MGYNIFGRRGNGESHPIRVGDDGSLTIGGSLPSVALASDDNAQHGIYTLSATPGTVTSIAVPSWATIAVLSDATHRVNWRVDGDPAVPGTNALTNGASVAVGAEAAIILHAGAATLRLASQTASASLRVTFRGGQPS